MSMQPTTSRPQDYLKSSGKDGGLWVLIPRRTAAQDNKTKEKCCERAFPNALISPPKRCRWMYSRSSKANAAKTAGYESSRIKCSLMPSTELHFSISTPNEKCRKMGSLPYHWTCGRDLLVRGANTYQEAMLHEFHMKP